MRTQLHPHNRAVYDRVMAAFDSGQRMTCVCHPTGTGKSYIIAAVSEHFSRVLIIAPSHFILRQQREVMKGWPEGIDFATYQGLTANTEAIVRQRQYDLIVLDEFHRTGADEWGQAVQTLLDRQPQAKVLGTSATPIRHLDGERNMADELFGGNVASEMSIADAWSHGILPLPTYVTGLFRWDKAISEATDRINRSQRLKPDVKRQRIRRLTNSRLEWDRSMGMPQIIGKHLPRGTRRVIVFCSHIDTIGQMCTQVSDWFRQAGFTLAGTYILHGDQPDSEQRRQMQGFESDEGEGVRLMFAINMLNEGLHVPRVGAVLMLRTTASSIIYMQQLGRCLTAANTERPLVLDMVDNITTANTIRGIADEYNRAEHTLAEQEGREPQPFEVIDYTLGVRQLIDKLVPRSKDCCMDVVRQFYDKHHRKPKGGDEEYPYMRGLTEIYRNDPDVKQLLSEIGYQKQYRPSYEEMVAGVLAYCKAHGHRPRDQRQKPTKELSWMKTLYHKYGDRAEVQQIFSEYGSYQDVYVTKKRVIADVESFYAEHGRLPTSKNGGGTLMSQMRRLRERLPDDPDVKRIYALKQHVSTLDERIAEYSRFLADNGRHARGNVLSERRYYSLWNRMRRTHHGNPQVQEIISKYGTSYSQKA